MGKRILVPMDGSPLSERALEVALEENPDADIVVLHVIDPTEPGYSYPLDVDLSEEPRHGSDEWYDRAEELSEDLFATAREMAAEYDVELTTELVVNAPSRAIVEYARENAVDHIIMGSHGRDGEPRILLGSVTEAVAFRSPVRVTLIR